MKARPVLILRASPATAVLLLLLLVLPPGVRAETTWEPDPDIPAATAPANPRAEEKAKTQLDSASSTRFLSAKYDEIEARRAELRAEIEERTRTLGPEHSDTLASRHNHAFWLEVLGSKESFAEAEAEHRAVLAIRERVLGAEHPDTLDSRYNVADALFFRGEHAEVEAECRAVFAIRERVLGAEHPDTLESRGKLDYLLRVRAMNSEAEVEHRSELAVRERELGAEDPLALLSRYHLADVLRKLGRREEALKEAEAAYSGFRQVQNDEDPWTEDAKELVEALKPKPADR